MKINDLTQSPTRGVFPVVGMKQPTKRDYMGENKPLFKMAYLYNKCGDSYEKREIQQA